MEIVELVRQVEKKLYLTEEKCGNLISNTRDWVKTYVTTSNLKALVINVSGGLDSAIVAALCQEKYTGVPLIGLSLPYDYNDSHSEKADVVGAAYCSQFTTLHLSQMIGIAGVGKTINLVAVMSIESDRLITRFTCNNKHNSSERVRHGNIRARTRMILAYDVARGLNGAVLSTDNYSELLAGFWTLHGDVGDIGPIQMIFKGLELPYIAKHLGIREDIITQPPSDGLNVTDENTDEAQLGVDYKTFDAIMYTYLQDNSKWDSIKDIGIVKNVIDIYNRTQYKRNNPVNIPRNILGLK